MQLHKQIPCTIMRGGTSKGVYLMERDLPPLEKERDSLLLRLMGSPDNRQIDGLGGATSVTSKVAIIAPSIRKDADVDYTFAQVSVDKAVVDYRGNCGNISSGVGPFAIENGLVKVSSPKTRVRVFNTNTKKLLIEEVETPNGIVNYDGDFSIDGVPGTAAPVKIIFDRPAGAVSGHLLPTGNVTDILDIPGFGALTVSIVDAANPLIFVKAEDIGMTGRELPAEIDNSGDRLQLLEHIRGVAAQTLGWVDDYRNSAIQSPAVPKMTIVAKAREYTTVSGSKISSSDINLLGRMMSMQKAHATYALTGAVCTACAAAIQGTVVWQAMGDSPDYRRIRIGHPSGIIEAGAEFRKTSAGEIIIENGYGYRTARLILKGTAFC